MTTWVATDLGLQSGGVYSIALGASSDGTVIVGQGDTGSSGGSSHAFRWTSGGGMVDLGLLASGTYSIARSCSADGAWVGGEADNALGNPTGFLWNGASLIACSPLSGGDQCSVYAISADGTKACGWSNNGAGDVLPVEWPTATPASPTNLGLFGSNVAGIATGLSTNGSILSGGTNNIPDAPWRYAGSLGAIPIPGGEAAGGLSCMALDGLSAAGATFTPSNGTPFIWHSVGGSSVIGVPSGDFGASTGISGDGLTVCGQAGTYPTPSIAWLWTLADGFTILPALAGGTNPLAWGMSSDASVIVGRSVQSGNQHAVFWSVESDFSDLVRCTTLASVMVAELWLGSTPAYVDLTNSANRRNFYSEQGGAQNLGTNGAAPFGTPPAIFLTRTGVPATFAINNGRGGPFPLSSGTLDVSTTNPPGSGSSITEALPGHPGQGVLGDYRNGNLYAFNPATYLDNGTQRKWVRRWRALPQTTINATRYSYLAIQMQTGAGVPAGTNPRLMLRWSDDGGHSWSNYRIKSAGRGGQTAFTIKFNRMGTTDRFSGSDRIWEVSSTDPFRVAILDAEVDVS